LSFDKNSNLNGGNATLPVDRRFEANGRNSMPRIDRLLSCRALLLLVLLSGGAAAGPVSGDDNTVAINKMIENISSGPSDEVRANKASYLVYFLRNLNQAVAK
jgi:hypothetical protein